MRSIICLLAVLVIQPRWAQGQTVLDSLLDQRPHTWWGSMVVDLAFGDTLFMRNAERSFIPASVTKLFTTSAALDQLGPDYQYVTRLYTDGIQDGRVLRGNLIVRGAGDPSTGSPGDEWMDLFHAFVDSLHARGIHEIHGDIIGDDNVFDDVPLGTDWSWDDLTYGYAAQISGLTFHDATVDLVAFPTSTGERATLTMTPDLEDYVWIENQTVTLPRYNPLVESHLRIPESNHIIISSEVPLGRTESEIISIHNPTLYFVHGLKKILASKDIRVHGRPLDIDDLSEEFTYSNANLIAQHRSPPLSELIATVNKDSHNLYAEHLLKTLGHERPESDPEIPPGSAAMGIAAAMRTYAKAKVDTARIQLVDGSGLSRKNLVSPTMTIALLRYMASYPDVETRDFFLSSLAVGGMDGTLEFRFPRNSLGHRRVLAKTGTLGNVSSLAGYILQDDQPRLAFVLFANHFKGSSSGVRTIQDSFVSALIRSYIDGNE